MARRKQSAGILAYRLRTDGLEVFLVHPGGPFWSNKDAGAWSIPKGEFEDNEDPLAAAQREFAEETGFHLAGEFRKLTSRKQRSGKVIHAWALKAEVDAAELRSNKFTIEWPPRSGITAVFPEVDRGEWFGIATAMQKINDGQRGFLEELQHLLTDQHSGPPTS
jgi:predicted NUDIX family NTP pyrophosphohydrolase